MDTDIIIIGAGAAGLMAAVGASQRGNPPTSLRGGLQARRGNLIILEKMPRPARKIMITGKGRCNFTNLKDWNEFSQHVHPKPNLLRPAFMNFPPARMIEFLEGCGLHTVVERGDRAFPASYRAVDVVDTLERAARDSGAEILCGKEVVSICPGGAPDGGSAAENSDRKPDSADCEGVGGSAFRTGFIVKCSDGSSYSCQKLIIATGGLSYPTTGSTGDGLAWASRLGLSITPTLPSLTAIVPAGYKVQDSSTALQKPSKGGAEFSLPAISSAGATQPSKPCFKGHIDRAVPLSESGKMLCGQSLENVGLSLIIDGNTVQEEFGDLDFTDGGLEGPIGFQVSRRCVRALANGSKASVVIDLKPAVELSALQARISRLWKEILQDPRSRGASEQTRFKVLLGKLLPREFIPGFIRWNPRLDEGNLARHLKAWNLDIAGFVGYERCVITAGGVAAEEISPKTLEVKRLPGLHIAGELLDLDADTGGYNLQIAFCTGYLAGQSAAK